jgi:hypothetical protein
MMKTMQNDFKEDARSSKVQKGQATTPEKPEGQRSFFSRWMNNLVGMGLGEPLLRIGTNLLSIAAIAVVIVLVQAFYRQAEASPGTAEQAPDPAESALVSVDSVPAGEDVLVIAGIPRSAQIHTNIPSRPRQEITTYTCRMAIPFLALRKSSGLSRKRFCGATTPFYWMTRTRLKPGQELNILPVDGVYWEWLGGITFGSWAEFYGVTAADIIEFPGNNIDRDTVGDYNNANIRPGTWLIIPGGKAGIRQLERAARRDPRKPRFCARTRGWRL